MQSVSNNFSVLMSVYYKEKPEYLNLSLDSVLKNQTLIPSEVILVCDGPLNSELYSVINEYKRNYPEILKTIQFKTNRGLGHALRVGIKHCSNEIVARMDTDDLCRKDRFAKQINFLKDNPDVAIVGSDVSEFIDDPLIETAYKRMPATNSDIIKYAKLRNPMSHQTVMFRKSAVLEAGSYKELHYLEDYYLWIRMLSKGVKFANINEPLVKYRAGSGVLNRRSDKSYVKNWKVLNDYMARKKMINIFEYYRNLLMVRVFIYSPVGFRKFAYRYLLRKKTE